MGQNYSNDILKNPSKLKSKKKYNNLIIYSIKK